MNRAANTVHILAPSVILHAAYENPWQTYIYTYQFIFPILYIYIHFTTVHGDTIILPDNSRFMEIGLNVSDSPSKST